MTMTRTEARIVYVNGRYLPEAVYKKIVQDYET